MTIHSHFLAPFAAALFAALTALPAAAGLLVEIDKSSQTMTVSQDGARLYTWPVSTGIRTYDTPGGAYTPFRMEKDHFSREWDDAPMPHSIFFTKRGHAIHGTTHLRAIGRPASHGCVRLEPQNARALFALVRREGMANTRVVLSGTTPSASPPAVARRAPGYGERPGYIERGTDDRDATFSTPRRDARDTRYDDRPGYWVRYPDGSREFIDRERDDRPPPPPFFLGRPPGW